MKFEWWTKSTLLALVIALAGCGGGGTDQISVTGTESLISVSVVEEVEQALGADLTQIEFTDPVILEPSTCLLHGAWQSDVLDAETRYFAQIAGEPVIQGPAEGAAEAVLQACFDDTGFTPSAMSIAMTVIRLDPSPIRLQLLTPNMASFLEFYNMEYQDPVTVENNGSTVTTFFANDVEVVGVLQVTATRSSDGSLSVEYTELTN